MKTQVMVWSMSSNPFTVLPNLYNLDVDTLEVGVNSLEVEMIH